MSVVQEWQRQGIVPAPLGRQLVLLAQPDLLLAVNGLRVWPGGVELRLELRYPPTAVAAGERWLDAVATATRIGVQLDEGEVTWFTLDPTARTTPGIEYTGGAASEGYSAYGWYVPLPPTWDVLTLHAVRGDVPGSAEGTASLDAEEMRQAGEAIPRSPWTPAASA